MVTYHGASVKLVIERLSDETKIIQEYIGTLNGEAEDQDFYTKNFPITWDLGEAGGVTGTVEGLNGETTTTFKTDLTGYADDYFNGMTIRFTEAALDEQLRIIDDYVEVDGVITVTEVFSEAPGADAFIIEPSVDVYTDDADPDGDPTEYDEDGTDYVITGLTGKVTIQAAENAEGNADERISISYYTTAEVGRGQSASIDFDGALEEIYHLGSRSPQEIKEGPITISGTIEQLYTSRDLIGKFLGDKDFFDTLTDFTFYLYPNGETTGQPQIKLENVKFGGGSLSVDIGGIMAASVTYKGLVMEVGSVP